jgi:hypothetical protein
MYSDQESFEAAARALAAANNISFDLASEYLSLIGDTPEMDENGLTIVRDDSGREIARVVFPPEDDASAS